MHGPGDDARLQDLLDRWEDARDEGRTLSAEQLCKGSDHLLPRLQAEIARLRKLDGMLNEPAPGRPPAPPPPSPAAPPPYLPPPSQRPAQGPGPRAPAHPTKPPPAGRDVEVPMFEAEWGLATEGDGDRTATESLPVIPPTGRLPEFVRPGTGAGSGVRAPSQPSAPQGSHHPPPPPANAFTGRPIAAPPPPGTPAVPGRASGAHAAAPAHGSGLRTPSGVGGTGGHPAARPADLRYTPKSFHARGGLGEVHVAEDEELHRDVALKRLLPDRARDPDAVVRFRQEAEITARLEHPGVVPVYGMGTGRDGLPCYAMRFVRGRTFDDAIADLHRACPPGADDSAFAAALMGLVRRFLTVCQTIAYAHNRGVVHRDIKPANILLGRYGETLVIDWGLAKTFDPAAPPPELESTGVLRISDLGVETTPAGGRKGSPAYMSPEQADGRSDGANGLSDVYALGATLYKLLTGRAPFVDHNRLWERIRAGEFPRPRELRADVPAALQAIALKAMSTRPEGRYAGAAEMAADIERWLADEPVAASPDARGVRMRRWARRHRNLLSAMASAITVGFAGMAVVAVLQTNNSTDLAAANAALNDGNAKLQSLNAELADARGLAETGRTRAVEALEQSRRQLYVNRLNSAFAALAENRHARVLELLREELPGFLDPVLPPAGTRPADSARPGSAAAALTASSAKGDQRGWEWRMAWGLHHREQRLIPARPAGPPVSDHPTATHFRKFWIPLQSEPGLRHPPDAADVQLLAFDATGERLAAARNRVLSVHDAATGRRLWSVRSAEAPFLAVAWQADGLLAAASGREVLLWRFARPDAAPGAPPPAGKVTPVGVPEAGAAPAEPVSLRAGPATPLVRIAAHGDLVRSLAFSPDGTRLYTAGDDRRIRSWEMPTGEPLLEAVIPQDDGPVFGAWGLTASADGKSLVLGGGGRSVVELSASDFRRSRTCPHPGGQIGGAAFLADGTLLAGVEDGTLRRVDARRVADPLPLAGSPGAVRSVRWLGNRAVAEAPAGPDVGARPAGRERPLLMVLGEGVPRLVAELPGGTWAELPLPTEHRSVAVAGSLPGGKLAALDATGRVWVWSLPRMLDTLLLRRHEKACTAVTFAGAGRLLVSGAELGSGEVFSGEPGRPPSCIAGEINFIAGPRAVWSSADGRTLAVGTNGGMILRSGKDGSPLPGPARDPALFSHLAAGAFSPSGDRFAFAIADQTRGQDGSEPGARREHRLRVWSLADNRELPGYGPLPAPVTALAWSPDGQFIAAGDERGVIRLRPADGSTGLPTTELAAPAGVTGLLYDDGGRRLLATDREGGLTAWTLADGRRLFTVEAHAGANPGPAGAPGAGVVITTGRDGVMRFWDAAHGGERGFVRLGVRPSAPAVSADGRLLAVGGQDGAVRVWEIPGDDEMLAVVKRRAEDDPDDLVTQRELAALTALVAGKTGGK